MAKSSIHIQPVKANSETHNLRLMDYKHVEKDLSIHNYSWGTENKISEIRKEINEIYQKKTGQRMQRKATPIREGVFLIEAHHKNEDVLKVVQKIGRKYGIKPLQLHIHRDEGHHKSVESGEEGWKPNLHAHVIFEWFNRDTGKTVKLDRKAMSDMQTDFAIALGMERGKKSLKTHLNAFEYKIKLAEEKLQEIQKKEFDLNAEIQFLENEKLTPREKTKLKAFEFLAEQNPNLKNAVNKAIPIIRKMNKSKGKSI